MRLNNIINEAKEYDIRLKKIADNFVTPTSFTAHGGKLYVTDQIGKIFIIEDGKKLDKPFFDISKAVSSLPPNKKDGPKGLNPDYDERGLLGMALHPEFSDNRRLFVFHSASPSSKKMNHKSMVVEYEAKDDYSVRQNTHKVLIEEDQEAFTHNGGHLAFGPDGYLYISMGDGGCCRDEHGDIGNAQDTSNIKGSILRIDVDHGDPYSMPKDNPFKGQKDKAQEIYAWGFRNPWKFSFTGKSLLVGNIGEDDWESVYLVNKGDNCGWRIKEGASIFDKGLANKLEINPDDLVDPIFNYHHTDSDKSPITGKSVIGGYVYRGSVASLKGCYVFADASQYWFADLEKGKKPNASLHCLKKSGDKWHYNRINYSPNRKQFITSFGEDENGELYVMTMDEISLGHTGAVYKIESR